MRLRNRLIGRMASGRAYNLRGLLLVVGAVLVLGASSGCVSHLSYTNPARMKKGLVLILPGIEGESMLNHMIAEGLKEAGVPDAIDIYDWTGTRWYMVGGVTRYNRNLRQAALIAHRLAEYQRLLSGPAGAPDRPQCRRRPGGDGPGAAQQGAPDHGSDPAGPGDLAHTQPHRSAEAHETRLVQLLVAGRHRLAGHRHDRLRHGRPRARTSRRHDRLPPAGLPRQVRRAASI